jgi:hypothetical protein
MQQDRAERAKEQGNISFKDEDYNNAYTHYTRAINYNNTNYVCYSNRSACLIKLKRYSEAKSDAEKCIHIAPDFTKGYLRLGVSLFWLGKYNESLDTLQAAVRKSSVTFLSKDEIKIINQHITACQKAISERGLVQVNIVVELPGEILDAIMQYLEPVDLIQCESVCSVFKELSCQEHLWKNHCRKKWIGTVKNQFTALFEGAEKTKHWREYYYLAEKDTKRTEITTEEFCKTWVFEISYASAAQMKGESTFMQNGSFTVDIEGYGRMQSDQMKWKLSDLNTKLVANNFPAMLMTRRNDRGWSCINDVAVMDSVDQVFLG